MPARKSKPFDPWAGIDALIADKAEPVGAEWFTRAQFAKRYGFSFEQTRRRLNALVETGSLEVWRGTASATKRTTIKYRQYRTSGVPVLKKAAA